MPCHLAHDFCCLQPHSLSKGEGRQWRITAFLLSPSLSYECCPRAYTLHCVSSLKTIPLSTHLLIDFCIWMSSKYFHLHSSSTEPLVLLSLLLVLRSSLFQYMRTPSVRCVLQRLWNHLCHFPTNIPFSTREKSSLLLSPK